MADGWKLVGCVPVLSLALGACEPGGIEAQRQALEDDMLAPALNLAGTAQTATASGLIDTANPFFAPLGTNGRACVTCHMADQGWTITPAGARTRFEATQGLDPLFRAHDAANAPHLDVSTVEARRQAYSLMLERAVVRVGLPVRDTAEFELAAVEDPYGHASAAQLSLFRRPLPISNLRFIATVNWDGRNTLVADPTNVRQALKNQSNGATVGHAKAATPIDDATRDAIVDFQLGLVHAQVRSWTAGRLDARGATGGPTPLLSHLFAIGANSGGGFDPRVFRIFDAWNDIDDEGGLDDKRRRIAEGQRIFNTRAFTVDLPGGTSFQGTCSTCHNAPEVGGGTTFRFADIGVSAPGRRATNVPLYTFRNKTTGELRQSTDPGRALISGRWEDMDRFKVPGLRGLAARAPYFHDGSARTIAAVVDFYQGRFHMGLTDAERGRLVAFLESL
jgi:cytochrome c peroxidase